MTLRRTLVAAALCVVGGSAEAEVWMVNPSGALVCKDRATLMQQDASASVDRPPEGCRALYPGERLLDQPEVGVGFDGYMRVQRHDGSFVYVRSSAVAPDPGIGSTLDRAE